MVAGHSCATLHERTGESIAGDNEGGYVPPEVLFPNLEAIEATLGTLLGKASAS